MLQFFGDATIIHLYKNKGDRASCNNHRGISLLRIAGNIMARVIMNRVTHHLLNDVISESPYGFETNRGTFNMIVAVRQLQKKCREQNQNILFVDLTKAFDTASGGSVGHAVQAWLSTKVCPDHQVIL